MPSPSTTYMQQRNIDHWQKAHQVSSVYMQTYYEQLWWDTMHSKPTETGGNTRLAPTIYPPFLKAWQLFCHQIAHWHCLYSSMHLCKLNTVTWSGWNCSGSKDEERYSKNSSAKLLATALFLKHRPLYTWWNSQRQLTNKCSCTNRQ